MTMPSFDTLKVGDVLPPLALPPIDRTTLALFAGASNDHNPMHIDIDFARKGRMPDVFAHGMLSMAYLGRLLTQWVSQAQVREFNARFAGITHLGHRITCSGKIVEKFEAGGERRVKLQIQTANQYGEVKILGDAVVAL
ncbi:acyl dehydratase [Cupriavidus basilensis OR16]|uniref:Acyl dehydratase n=1 Tax=Cupriavidus basilensis OR16 TaxID=1127483 RepID=H1S619_9BURK|nr:MaoC/PaaZ C-terminal domain-containing protein [Cupriavidus basilensis]EHP42062.1 acyl dehydratase [Cupriavidus basilensis OR16]